MQVYTMDILTQSTANWYLGQGAAQLIGLCPAHTRAHDLSVLQRARHGAHTHPEGCVEPSSTLFGASDYGASLNQHWLFSEPSSAHRISWNDKHISSGNALDV